MRPALVACLALVAVAPAVGALPPVWVASNGLAPAADGIGTDSQTTYCGGTAPTQFSCATGAHRFATIVDHGCQAGLGFTGTITSVVRWGGGIREYTCAYSSAQPVVANGQGAWPPAFNQFFHECYASGVGPWECWIDR